MKYVAKVFIIVILFFLLSSSHSTFAQIEPTESTSTKPAESIQQETITSFVSDITVNTDNSIDVTEVIHYVTATNQSKHGIYRDIRPYSSEGKKMNITDIVVVDENGASHPFSVSTEGEFKRIKIGDADVTFTGEKIYRISYHASHAIAKLQDSDEIYWNVTGSTWKFPIYQVTAQVKLPNNTEVLKTACYFGRSGAKNLCQSESSNGVTTFTGSSLGANEGLTIATSFPKGVVLPYSKFDTVLELLYVYWKEIAAVFITGFIFLLFFRNWYNNGRDPKGTGVIVPQYDVIDDLTPVEVSVILADDIQKTTISAEIIYLATKGYLKITQVETKTLGFFKSVDYELTALNLDVNALNRFDRKLYSGLFGAQSGSVKNTIQLSKLKNKFYTTVDSIISIPTQDLFEKGYYKNLGRMSTGIGKDGLIMFIVGGVMISFFLFMFLQSVVISLCTLFIGISGAVFWYISPAKSEKGVEMEEYIRGLKLYLGMAEKRRLEFHNAPEKKPEVFEKLLPYALALGVADIWAKEFEGIYTTPPDWYSGADATAFNAVVFSNSLSSFSSFANSTYSSPSSSEGGGSGGWGSSGGGGGGGGGGSW